MTDRPEVPPRISHQASVTKHLALRAEKSDIKSNGWGAA
jgi:hypothetical protein